MKKHGRVGGISLCLILVFLCLWKMDKADFYDGQMKEDAFLSFADAAVREAEEADRKAMMEKIKAEEEERKAAEELEKMAEDEAERVRAEESLSLLHEHASQTVENSFTPTHKNPFWFSMDKTEKRMEVFCELNYADGVFSGNGILVVRGLPEIKLGNCYEIFLTDLEGECQEHNDITYWKCCYACDFFPLGYYYVTDDKIYEFAYLDETVEMLNQWDTFPPDIEYMKNGMTGQEGYPFAYWREVCSEEGFEDTFYENHSEENMIEFLYKGRDLDERYHNFITVDGDERRYNLWPETFGTQEHTYMTWKRGMGITRYMSYAGNFLNSLSFHIPGCEGY